tara:strand:+ start:80 stop:463 length:384 start_codon:yes stop_codon:yes gene_type:complete
MKYISNNNYDIKIFLSLTFFLLGVLSLIYLLCNHIKLKKFIKDFNINFIYLILFLATIIILTNYFTHSALKLSPNISYCHLIINLNVIVTLLASYFLFKEKFNFKSFIGIIITLIGITIVLINSKSQ